MVMNRSPRPVAVTRRVTSTATMKPSVPDVPPVTQALAGAVPLISLMQRLEASNRCFEVVRSFLPGPLANYVRPGPIDDEGWTLLAANSAVSAKLRQLQPRLIEVLQQHGIKVMAIRVRVQSA